MKSDHEFYLRFSKGSEECKGTGSIGSVMRCLWDGEQAAVKDIIYQRGQKTNTKDHIRKVCNSWVDLIHHNVIQIYGLHFGKQKASIVMEYASNGSLDEMITKFNDGSSGNRLQADTFLKWSKQIAGALAYIHSKEKVHRDLKWNNVVLDKDNNAKICDFDYLRDVTSSMSSGGCFAIIAPELWLGEHAKTSKSDIWSFSLLVLFLVKGCSPVDRDQMTFATKMKDGWRPPIPEWCPYRIRGIIKSCWKYDPEERPSAEKLHEMFVNLEILAKKVNQKDVPITKFDPGKSFI